MADVFSGRRVARGVVVCLLLTAVLPPLAAAALARWRVARAETLAASTAEAFARHLPVVRDRAGEAVVVTGPGRLPRVADEAAGWVQNPVDVSATPVGAWSTDPWGRCYLIRLVGIAGDERGLVISAGPNGQIDTPLGAPAPVGDDIGAIIR